MCVHVCELNVNQLIVTSWKENQQGPESPHPIALKEQKHILNRHGRGKRGKEIEKNNVRRKIEKQ